MAREAAISTVGAVKKLHASPCRPVVIGLGVIAKHLPEHLIEPLKTINKSSGSIFGFIVTSLFLAAKSSLPKYLN